jgi:hypothetical protein
VRSRHGRAAKIRIRTVGGVIAGARACARRRNIGFDPPASIGYNGAATAKACNGIGPCLQGSCGVSCRVKSGWILHRGTTRPGVLRGGYHHDTSSRLCLDSSLQRIKRTTFRRRALPGVIGDVRRLGRVGVAAANPGRRQEPLHAFDVTSWCTIVGVHVAATNPLRAGRHPNLVTHAIISDHRARGVAAMAKVIARERRIIPTGVPHAVVDGVVPIVIVIGNHAVPTAVVRLKRVMCPANARIPASYNNALPGET